MYGLLLTMTFIKVYQKWCICGNMSWNVQHLWILLFYFIAINAILLTNTFLNNAIYRCKSCIKGGVRVCKYFMSHSYYMQLINVYPTSSFETIALFFALTILHKTFKITHYHTFTSRLDCLIDSNAFIEIKYLGRNLSARSLLHAIIHFKWYIYVPKMIQNVAQFLLASNIERNKPSLETFTYMLI